MQLLSHVHFELSHFSLSFIGSRFGEGDLHQEHDSSQSGPEMSCASNTDGNMVDLPSISGYETIVDDG